jgi:hypothetical protein
MEASIADFLFEKSAILNLYFLSFSQHQVRIVNERQLRLHFVSFNQLGKHFK